MKHPVFLAFSHLYPERKDGVEAGRLADGEASIPVEKSGRGSIRHKVLPHCDEHGHFGAVLGGIENLLHFEL